MVHRGICCFSKTQIDNVNNTFFLISGKDGSKVTTVLATAGTGSDRTQEVSYTDAKVIGNGSFGVVYQAKLVETNELVAIKKVLQDKRFKVSINHMNFIELKRRLICFFINLTCSTLLPNKCIPLLKRLYSVL